MSNQTSSLGGRLPLLNPTDLDGDQRRTYNLLTDKMVSWANESGFKAATEAGQLIGPFNAMLFSPRLTEAEMTVLGVEKQYTALSPTVREVVILTVGTLWNTAYEIYAHTAVAKKVGLDSEAVEVIKRGETPTTLPIDESVAHEFTFSLVKNHRIDQELYSRAVETFGEKGVVDMIYLAGTYMTVSGLLNTFEVPAPE